MTGDPLGYLENVPAGTYRSAMEHPEFTDLTRQLAREGLHVTDTDEDTEAEQMLADAAELDAMPSPRELAARLAPPSTRPAMSDDDVDALPDDDPRKLARRIRRGV